MGGSRGFDQDRGSAVSVIKLHWYCGCFVGPSKWHGTEVYEPDECTAEGEIEVDPDDWIDGIVAINCTSCGAELTQCMGHFDVVSWSNEVNGQQSKET